MAHSMMVHFRYTFYPKFIKNSLLLVIAIFSGCVEKAKSDIRNVKVQTEQRG